MLSQRALQVVSQHALQVVSQHALQQVGGGGSRPTPEGDLVQAHSQGEIEGDLVWEGGACSQEAGGCLVLGVPGPGGGAAPGGGALWSAPDGYCCRRYASYWNAFLFYDVSMTRQSCTNDI